MSTFDEFMIDKAVKDDAEVVRLRTINREMLEALERLVDSRGDDRWELAWAAIQKARGGQ